MLYRQLKSREAIKNNNQQLKHWSFYLLMVGQDYIKFRKTWSRPIFALLVDVYEASIQTFSCWTCHLFIYLFIQQIKICIRIKAYYYSAVFAWLAESVVYKTWVCGVVLCFWNYKCLKMVTANMYKSVYVQLT